MSHVVISTYQGRYLGWGCDSDSALNFISNELTYLVAI